MAKLRFGIVGGDKRQIKLYESLVLDGHLVHITGFENYSDDIKNSNLKSNLKNSDYIILPIPVSQDKKFLNMPFSKNKVEISENFIKLLENKKVFCYDVGSLLSICKNFKKINLYDFSRREEFVKENAVLTAIGAIDIAIKNYEKSIYGSRCLVCGFGRIGSALAPLLKSMGAIVSVSARKIDDILMIKSCACKAILTSDIYKSRGYDLIFNTVPSQILGYKELKYLTRNSLIIDLASFPGGLDKRSVEQLNLRLIHALGVPGKFFPESSGKIIKNTIYNMIWEEDL